MPNTVDSVSGIHGALQSGVVVSGNSYITVAKVLTSGDSMSSFRVSGFTDMIMVKQARNVTKPLLGGTFNEVQDYVEVEIFVRTPSTTTTAATTLRTRVDDTKITIASGTFANMTRPLLYGENAPVFHENQAKTTLTYVTKYLL